ncbi:MAG: ABC transporter ATP-binding protein [Ruminococcaceae bacterium]|nr:ABC transporter ATP-binding protein [Oscillospiraceae bacterium]
MIRFDKVSKSFGDKKVIDVLSFEISKGEKVCLTGPSGSGKTTALRLIMGFEKADQGEVLVDGRISAVFQEDRLFPTFTALENVKAVCDDEGLALQVLKTVGLLEDKDKLITQLSGGMARRVAIARALAYPFDILVLDEPFTGIDESRKNEIIGAILDEVKDKTLILVSHDEDECSLMCRRRINVEK